MTKIVKNIETEKDIFKNIGAHVCENEDIVKEKLDSIENLIFTEKWEDINDIILQVKELDISKEDLENFAEKTIGEFFSRNDPFLLNKIYTIFVSLEINDEFWDVCISKHVKNSQPLNQKLATKVS